MKRIISLILCVLIIQTSVVNALAYTINREDGTIIDMNGNVISGSEAPSEEEEPEPDIVYEKWNVLEMFYTLGITDEATITYSALDEPISKGLFVYLLGNMYFYGSEQMLTAVSNYSDVGINHYASAYLEGMSSNGIIDGIGDGSFDVNKNISLEEAYKLVVAALGYGEYATLKGGYPSGYTSIAQDLKLTVDAADRSQLTRREALRILYNMLRKNIMVYYPTGNKMYEEGGEFINERMGLYYGKGIVYSSGAVSVGGNAAGDGSAFIGDALLLDSNKLAESYIGHYVTYYYNENNELVCLEDEKTNTFTVNSYDIVELKNNKLIYTEGNRNKSINIISSISIIENGREAKSIDALVPDYGEIQLIDNNNDGKYEVAIVSDYLIYYVKETDSEKTSLYLSNGNGDTVIKTDEYENISVKDADGNELDLKSLKKGNAVMLQLADDFLQITKCTKTVEGNVMTSSSDDCGSTYMLGETEIKVPKTAYFEGLQNGALTGSTVKMYLDIYGRAAAVIAVNDNSTYTMGYLYSVTYDENQDTCYFVIGDSYGDYITYYTKAERLKIDGAMQKLSACYNNITEKTPVRFKAEDRIITALDLPRALSFFDSENDNITDTEDDCLYKRLGGNVRFMESQGILYPLNESGYADGTAYRSSGCITYALPSRANIGTAGKNDIGKMVSSFSDDTVYDIDGFTVGKDSYNTDFLLVYGQNDNTVTYNTKFCSAMLVTDIVKEWDTDSDETRYKVTGLLWGQTKTYYVENELGYASAAESEKPYAIKDFSEVKKGDVIRFTTNRYQRIAYCMKEYMANGTGRLNKTMYTDSNIGQVNRYVNAKMLGVNGSIIAFQAKDESLPPQLLSISSTYMKMYYYDRATKTVRSATTTDLQFAVNDPDYYEAVLIGSYHIQGRDLYLIK